MNSPVIPFIPDTAPFTAEQRAWLNGFFAGIFSGAAAAEPQAPTKPLTILFGSQTGTCEAVAKQTAKAFRAGGFVPKVVDLADYAVGELGQEKHLLVVTSTYGEGEMPDNAKSFWEFLSGPGAPPLSGVEFSVLALGDTVYSTFCDAGKKIDARLEQLGAKRVYPRVDCDKDYEKSFKEWLKGVQSALGSSSAAVAKEESEDEPPGRKPQPARLAENRKLNAAGSAKDTRHFDISFDSSGLTYEVGDALGIMPMNCPEMVDDILFALGCDGEEGVPAGDGQTVALRKALLEHYDIKSIPKPLLDFTAERSADEALRKMLLPASKADLDQFLWGREVVDLLLTWPQVKFRPEEFVNLLRKLQHRLYSISSSPKANPGRVHLTVAVVRYESHGRPRKGICSTFLAERATGEAPVPIFIQPNKGFRLPANSDTPVIMVGPGTGVAPFRAFLQERRAVGAKGRNWLFFGDQCAGTDFLYREELETLQKEGALARLDTAFSRDQKEKVYVQHRMIEQAKDLFAWLEDGAHFYVCGDASRMAKDVDKALHEAIATGGGRTAESAAEYVKKMQKEKRYQRDVY